MEINKDFNNNGEIISVLIAGTYTEPIFCCYNISEMMNLKNILLDIKDFDETQKISFNYSKEKDIDEDYSDRVYLTVNGFYDLLFKQRKNPQILKIQKWLCNTIKEIFIDEINYIKFKCDKKINKIIENLKSITNHDDSDESDDDF